MALKIQKFDFGEIFEKSHMAVNDPKYSHLEMEQFTIDHFQKGFNAGKDETQKDIDAMNTHHLQQVHGRLTEVLSLQQEMFVTLAENVSHVCRIVTGKMLPAMVDKGALDEILEVVNLAFKAHKHDNFLKIYVGSSYQQALMTRLEEKLDKKGEASFEVISDETLQAADCRVEWETGGVERLTDHIHLQIQTALERLTSTADYQREELQNSNKDGSLESNVSDHQERKQQ